MSLTIAQALRKIKKLKGVISEETARMKSGVSYVKDAEPEFRFASSEGHRLEAQDEMIDLESKVAAANAVTFVELSSGKISLSKAIRQLQELKGDISLYKELVLNNKTVKEREDFYSEELSKYVTSFKEIVHVSVLSEIERDKIVKDLANRFDELNTLVEDANHKTQI